VLEMQAADIQSRLAFDSTAILLHPAGAVENRQLDPIQPGPEPGAPDDVRNVENLAVVEQRFAVAGTGDAGDPADTGGVQVSAAVPGAGRLEATTFPEASTTSIVTEANGFDEVAARTATSVPEFSVN